MRTAISTRLPLRHRDESGNQYEDPIGSLRMGHNNGDFLFDTHGNGSVGSILLSNDYGFRLMAGNGGIVYTDLAKGHDTFSDPSLLHGANGGRMVVAQGYIKGCDGYRYGDILYQIRQNLDNAVWINPTYVYIWRHHRRTGAWNFNRVMLPRKHNSPYCNIIGVFNGYLVFAKHNPAQLYAVPIDRCDRAEDIENLPMFSWLSRQFNEYQSLVTQNGVHACFRSFRRAESMGNPNYAVYASVSSTQDGNSSSLILAIDMANRSCKLRFAPDIRFHLNRVLTTGTNTNLLWEGVSSLALGDDGLLMYRCSNNLVAAVDITTGETEAFVIPFYANGSVNVGGVMEVRKAEAFLAPYIWAVFVKAGNQVNPWAEVVDLLTGEVTRIDYERYEISEGGDVMISSYDDAGYLWMRRMYNGSATTSTSYAGSSLISSYLDAGIMSDGGLFGFSTNKWKDLYLKRIHTSNRIILTNTVRRKSDLHDAFDASDKQEDSVIVIKNDNYRNVTNEEFNPALLPEWDPVADIGKVLGSYNGEYDWVSAPRPLPDWFNGCTPVYDNDLHAWRAGDALIDLPRVRRSDVVWVSKNKRWEPKVLPWSFYGNTDPTTHFRHITFDRPYWPMYISGAYRQWATDSLPAADGQSQGYLWPVPGDGTRARGSYIEDLGVCGALNNYWWEGSQETSNRRFSNFWPVRNPGTGRWEPGDMIDTCRKDLDSYSDCWHKTSGFTVVCRTNNFEPGCLYGEDHKDMFMMLGRFMSRQWMRGALTRNVPVRFECQIADVSDFTNIVAEFDTAIDVTGWQFEHTDGGQSAFLPSGPTATTVKGVVFDPYHAGFLFDRTLHFYRWRCYINNGPASEWAPGMMTNLETDWRRMALIENQRFVNHIVIPELGDQPFPGDGELVDSWMFSKKETTPIGGAAVFIPVLKGETRSVFVDLEIGDGVWFDRAEVSSPSTEPDAWGLIADDGTVLPYPEDGIIPNTNTRIFFDPVKAGVSSRVGTRFFRYRYIVNGDEIGRWHVKQTVTTERVQLRTDNLSVVGINFERDQSSPVVLARNPHSQVSAYAEVSDNNYGGMAHVSNDVVTGNGEAEVSYNGDAGGDVLLLAHGLYDVIRDKRINDIWWLSNKRRDLLELPPMYEQYLNLVFQSWRSVISPYQTNNRYLLSNSFKMNANIRLGTNMTSYDYFPGSSIVSLLAPDFDVNQMEFHFKKTGDFLDYTSTTPPISQSTSMSPDRRFFSLVGDSSSVAGYITDAYEGRIIDTVLGTPRSTGLFIHNVRNEFPMAVDEGLFFDPGTREHSYFNRLIEPRTGCEIEAPMVPFHEYAGVDLTAYSAQFRNVEYSFNRKELMIQQISGLGKYYRFKNASDEYVVTEAMARGAGDWIHHPYQRITYDPVDSNSRWFKGPADIPMAYSGRGAAAADASSNYWRRYWYPTRLGRYMTWMNLDYATVLFYRGPESINMVPFPMYSGFYPRVTVNGNYQMYGVIKMQAGQVAVSVGSLNLYERVDSGVIDTMFGWCRPFIPIRNVTSTNNYNWQSSFSNDGYIILPQDYRDGALVLGTMVGGLQPLLVGSTGHEITLNIYQTRGR